MTMDYSRRLSIALLITAVMMGVGSNKPEEQSDTCVWVGVEVDFDSGRNSSADYIGDLMRRLKDVEDQMRDMKQSIAVMDNKISEIDNRELVMNNNTSTMNGSCNENNESATYMSKMEVLHWQIFRERLVVCTNITKAIDQDTANKCMTMQMGVKNGSSVSVYTWVIQDYNNKVEKYGLDHYSQPFYHTVPGYKYRLRGDIYSDGDIYLWLQLLPGEYDDQLNWPFSQKYDVTVLTNDGLEALQRSFAGEQSTCHLNRSISGTDFKCHTRDPNWSDVLTNKKLILDDDSVVAKLYFYN